MISQSGETADTIAAQREAKAKGSKTLAICNVVGSMITREAAGTIYTHAGPEIGVASTKAFTAQLTALYLFALYLGQVRGVRLGGQSEGMQSTNSPASRASSSICSLTRKICEDLAKQYVRSQDFLFLGRGIHYPIALEGALKLKEISYIHAEGYPAGEMKHGPNALIDENLPVVIIATRDPKDALSMVRYEKTSSNLKEVKARSGQVIAIATEGDHEIKEAADHVIYVPEAPEELLPILEIVPLAVAGLSHRGAARLRRRSAEESGEVGDGGVGKDCGVCRTRLPKRLASSFTEFSPVWVPRCPSAIIPPLRRRSA